MFVQSCFAGIREENRVERGLRTDLAILRSGHRGTQAQGEGTRETGPEGGSLRDSAEGRQADPGLPADRAAVAAAISSAVAAITTAATAAPPPPKPPPPPPP
jgi:hypothetical protein